MYSYNVIWFTLSRNFEQTKQEQIYTKSIMYTYQIIIYHASVIHIRYL